MSGTLATNLAETGSGLERGLTLPTSWYTDPEFLKIEREAIFARSWQYAGHTSRVQETGDYFTCMAGHIPIVVLRDTEGQVRAFLNACRHRGYKIAEGEGCRQSLQCHYHGWTYGLDGRLRAAPRSEREPAFDASGISLIPIRCETWGPLIFVNPDVDAGPLEDTLGEIPALAESRGLDLDAFPFRRRHEYDLASNWKVMIDNGIECYHCPTCHPSFAELYHVDSENYQLDSYDKCFVHSSRLKTSAPDAYDYQMYYVWPNFMMSVRRERGFFPLVVYPVDATRSVMVGEFYFSAELYDEAAVDEQVEFANQTLYEDVEIVGKVQEGLNSGLLPAGPLLMHSEEQIHRFQSLVYDSVSAWRSP
jgi:phenylpropionate dioxygenase-like ring-hydroxylating dioxygenase large terminal subunit